MSYVIVVAGMSVPIFDEIRKKSENLFAPNGHLVMSPVAWNGYSEEYIKRVINNVYEIARKRNEADQFQTLLIYVDYGDESTDAIKEAFFPFALSFPFGCAPSGDELAKADLIRAMKKYVEDLLLESRRIRAVSRIVTSYTSVANLTPLLLPPTNFRNGELLILLRSLYDGLPLSDDADRLIGEAMRSFKARCPVVYPPSESRNCFSDGRLFFRSPGKDRHGFFRNSVADQHAQKCLLNARSRIGGAYPHSFHYDCTPVKGKIGKNYPNCHGELGDSKERHVNISPSDYVI